MTHVILKTSAKLSFTTMGVQEVPSKVLEASKQTSVSRGCFLRASYVEEDQRVLVFFYVDSKSVHSSEITAATSSLQSGKDYFVSLGCNRYYAVGSFTAPEPPPPSRKMPSQPSGEATDNLIFSVESILRDVFKSRMDANR